MAKQNSENYFQISASVIKQLGEELISDEVTALMELVKNAYDADTKEIKITLSTEGTLGKGYKFEDNKGYVIIQDFGVGMSKDSITENWLVISHSAKREMKRGGKSTEAGRIPLGDKGLGRLSTQKIAQNIELITKVAGEAIAHHVAFSWDSFKPELMVSDVEVERFTKEKKKNEHGTSIVLSNLKNVNVWKGEARDRFRAQLSQLLYPVPNERPVSILLTIDGEPLSFDELNNQIKKIAACKYSFDFSGDETSARVKIKGRLSLKKLRSGNSQSARNEYSRLIEPDNGKAFFKFLTSEKNKTERLSGLKKLDYVGSANSFFDFEHTYDVNDLEKVIIKNKNGSDSKEKTAIASPGDFFGELYDIPKDELNTEMKNYVQNLIGIRVYKNGFGVKPYGFDKNDWLQLGQTWSSGSSYYGLKPGGTIGYVSLTLANNYSLAEKTDREGFIDTPYSRNFTAVVKDVVVKEVNDIVERTRRSFNLYRKQFYAKNTEEVITHKQSTQRIIVTANKAKSIFHDSDEFSKKLDAISTDVLEFASAKGANLDKETLKKLTSLKNVLAESSGYLNKANSLLNEVMSLEKDARFLDPYIEDIEERIAQFSELAGLGLTAEALTHELYHLLDRANVHLNELVKQIKKKDFSQPFEHTEGLSTFLKSLRVQVNHLSPILKYNRERKEHISIKDFLDETVSFFKNRTNQIDVEVVTRRGFTIKINRGKLTQIFDNLLFNSEYWLKAKKIVEPKFKPLISITIENSIVTVRDNGNGIDQGVVDRLFQPFVTTKPKGIGRGLGLFITRNILENAECEIELLPDKNKLGNRYIFQIDFSSIIA